MAVVIILLWGKEAGNEQKIIPALENIPVIKVALTFSVLALLPIPNEFVNRLKVCSSISVLH